jgi:hypothetical protein
MAGIGKSSITRSLHAILSFVSGVSHGGCVDIPQFAAVHRAGGFGRRICGLNTYALRRLATVGAKDSKMVLILLTSICGLMFGMAVGVMFGMMYGVAAGITLFVAMRISRQVELEAQCEPLVARVENAARALDRQRGIP